MSGSCARARAMNAFCLWPPDSRLTSLDARSASPMASRASDAIRTSSFVYVHSTYGNLPRSTESKTVEHPVKAVLCGT